MNYSFLVALMAVAVIGGIPLLFAAANEGKRRRARRPALQAEVTAPIEARRRYSVLHVAPNNFHVVIAHAMTEVAEGADALPKNRIDPMSPREPQPPQLSIVMQNALAWSQRTRAKA